MKPIAIYYHCHLFDTNNAPRPHAIPIITSQMIELNAYQLPESATDLFIGVNGGEESVELLRPLVHDKAQYLTHGLDARSETPTIVRLQEWCKEHPSHLILYFHSKGVSHTDDEYLKFVTRWRRCMMQNLVIQWRKCVSDLEDGCDSVGCHWMMNVGVPPIDNIWGGNFWWAKAEFINTLDSIMERDLIKQHGVNAPISRYEAERFLGAGPKLPIVKDYHVNGIGSCP